MKPNDQNNKKITSEIILCRHTQTSRISIWISAMVTNRLPLIISSLFIHATMHLWTFWSDKVVL